MIAVAVYLIALFFIGLGSAIVTYHILRYRDANDISLLVLVVYYALIVLILIATTSLYDWPTLFNGIASGQGF